MQKKNHSKFFLVFLTVIAVIGLALVPLFLLSPNLQVNLSPFRRPAVGSLYGVICFLGIAAVFYPGKCRLTFQKPNAFPNAGKSSSTVQFRGHHPDCEQFSANRVTIRGSVFCAACSGLLVGAVVALVGTVLFSLSYLDLAAYGLLVLVVGEVLMLLGLAQIKMSGYIKLAVNALFVVGSFFCLIAVDLVGKNLPVDVYMLGLIVYLLWFRILLSETNNKRTCQVCRRC